VDAGPEGASNVPSQVIKGSQLANAVWRPLRASWHTAYAGQPFDVLHVSQPDVGHLLTPDDVCALLKVKKSWLYDAVENGAVDAIRLGKQLRFRPSALIRYLDEHASKVN